MTCFLYDAIVFDFDGTLVDSNEIKTWAFGKLYEDHGEEIVRQVIAYHRENRGVSRFIKFRYWHNQLLCQHFTKEIEDELVQSYSSLVIEAVVKASYINGAKEFLKAYHKKLPLFVASGTPELEIREIIVRRGMSPFFAGVFGSPANKTEILKNICKQNCFAPKRVLMVGDTLVDWEGARIAETSFLGVQIPGHSSDLPEGALINSLQQLESYI